MANPTIEQQLAVLIAKVDALTAHVTVLEQALIDLARLASDTQAAVINAQVAQ